MTSSIMPGQVAEIMKLLPKVQSTVQPVLQLVHLKRIEAEGSKAPRFRATLTDGVGLVGAMFSSQYVAEISTGTIDVGSVLKITNFMMNEVSQTKLAVILNCEVLSVKEPLIMQEQQPYNDVPSVAAMPPALLLLLLLLPLEHTGPMVTLLLLLLLLLCPWHPCLVESGLAAMALPRRASLLCRSR